MSSDVFARAVSFATKADELLDKGHLLRAAENYGRAAEAARALGVDNLVALNMQLHQGNPLCIFVTWPDAAVAPRVLAAHRAELITLLSGVMAALERRRVAGTLLEGKCTAVEEAWRANELQRDNANMPAVVAASWAALVGYNLFLHAANNASEVLARARLFAAECSGAHFLSFAQHAAHAAELMQQPRRHGNIAMDLEAVFADELRRAVAAIGANNGLSARVVQLLAGAWERLQRSGVLQARRLEDRIGALASYRRNFITTVHKSMTAPGLRTCALPGCGAKEAHPAHFKSCAACRAVVYCCREHQVAGWPGHKKACKAARKAAAAEAGDEAGASST